MSFYMKLQPLEQFEFVCMVAGACVFFALILRELFNDREIQIAGRALGGIGFVVLVLFSWRMAADKQTLQAQIQNQQMSYVLASTTE